MKKSEVTIGGQYKAKVTDKVVTVEILAENPNGGWDAKNLATGKKVRIKSAQRLRGPAATAATSARGARSSGRTATAAADAKSTDTAKPGQNSLRVKKASILDAAVRVLAEKKEPLACKEMVETMVQKEYWQPSKGGKTPANTLYAAILKEINTKGAESRFEKVGRGQFTLAKKS
jgi:hypothetical protein